MLFQIKGHLHIPGIWTKQRYLLMSSSNFVSHYSVVESGDPYLSIFFYFGEGEKGGGPSENSK